MQKRKIGNSDLYASVMGFGCMSMSDVYGKADRAESIATLHHAFSLGINFFDTADVYGAGGNEEILAEAFSDIRDEVIIASKFGIMHEPSGQITGLSGKPDYVRKCCDASLRRLGTDVIDLYYLHRPDPDTPIEETVGAMAEMVAAGKVRCLGLSEVSGEQLKRAHGVHPIAAVQSEYSLWCVEVEDECLDAIRELGAALVPYSPLGRGFLTGSIRKSDDLPEGDFRRLLPRFQEENLQQNLKLVRELSSIAEEKRCTPGQAALAWIYSRGEDMFPIPGTRRRAHLEENAAAVEIHLLPDELETLNQLTRQVAGDRYGESMSLVRPQKSPATGKDD